VNKICACGDSIEEYQCPEEAMCWICCCDQHVEYHEPIHIQATRLNYQKSGSYNMENQNPIQLTQAAIDYVSGVLEQEDKSEQGLRFGIEPGGCAGMQYYFTIEQKASPEDVILQFDNVQVFVDARALPFITNTTIDYVDGIMGSGFKIDNPNVQSSCGCGNSFA